MPQSDDRKVAARKVIDGAREQLVDLSHRLHDNPELAFEEVRSSERVADVLAGRGLDVEMGICDLATAFVARAGQGLRQ